MGTAGERKSRPMRRVLRTFFAHRGWLLVLLAAGGAIGAAASFLQERVYQGRLEVACAPESAPTRVVLPDNARLWQLVYSPDNLRVLSQQSANPVGALERINRSIKLAPLSEVSPGGSAVWSLDVEIPAKNPGAAKELLDRYSVQLDAQFRQRTLLARRSRGSLPMSPRSDRAVTSTRTEEPPSEPVDRDVVPAGFEPAAIGSAETPGSDDAASVELARDLGVSVDRLPFVLDQFAQSITRRSADLSEGEKRIEQWMRTLKRIESSQPLESLPPDLETWAPELVTMIEERQSLERERGQLSLQLKPAHPEYRALERGLLALQDRIVASKRELTARLQSEIQRTETEVKRLRDEIGRDRERLAHVQGRLGVAVPMEGMIPLASPTRVPVVPVPTKLEPVFEAGVPAAVPGVLDRPIGRVVVRAGVIEPAAVQPRTWRNITLGILAGLLVYLIAVVFRAGSDQRIHGIDDLESLSADLNVFGSIPRLRRVGPVAFENGRPLS